MIILMYLLMVFALMAGTWTVDNLFLGTDHDSDWWVFVIGGSLVLALPIVVVGFSDAETIWGIVNRIVK